MARRKKLLRFLLFLLSAYAICCGYLYLTQESILFAPKPIEGKELAFTIPFEEFTIPTGDGNTLSGALFRANPSSDKLVFFVHGNAGNLEDQQGVAEFYNRLGWDFFTFDYRSYGKSTGQITSEQQFYADARTVYAQLKKRYAEKNIAIIGYSIGSATATMLASENHPAKFALLAPYYSMEDMAIHEYKIVPPFIVAYKFATYSFLPRIAAPICIFHGKNDVTIPFYSSKMLAGLLKKGDLFFPLKSQGHNDIESHPVFAAEMARFLRN